MEVFHWVVLPEVEQYMAFGCPVPDVLVLRVMFCFSSTWSDPGQGPTVLVVEYTRYKMILSQGL